MPREDCYCYCHCCLPLPSRSRSRSTRLDPCYRHLLPLRSLHCSNHFFPDCSTNIVYILLARTFISTCDKVNLSSVQENVKPVGAGLVYDIFMNRYFLSKAFQRRSGPIFTSKSARDLYYDTTTLTIFVFAPRTFAAIIARCCCQLIKNDDLKIVIDYLHLELHSASIILYTQQIIYFYYPIEQKKIPIITTLDYTHIIFS